MILNKIETFTDKIKSVKDIKKELRAFFSINGYSEALGTNSLFKKAFSLIAFIALFASCMFYVDDSVRSFQANDVVTQIKMIDDQTMTFPAVTFCVTEYSHNPLNFTSKDFSSKIIDCTFDSQTCHASIYFKHVRLTFSTQKLDCYSFNSGSNRILSSKGVGFGSGLSIAFNLSGWEKLGFAVHDNNEIPTFAELHDVVEQDGREMILVQMKKTIETKEPFPYSNCSGNIHSETSHLVGKILQQNITYRQRDCYDLCLTGYIDNYPGLQKLTNREALNLSNNFDFKGNCSKLCPLECTSTTFEISKNEFKLGPSDPIQLRIIFYYSDRKYTEITQSIKMKLSDFISNAGGLLGLFLDLSFFSAYRFIIVLLDLIFVRIFLYFTIPDRSTVKPK